MVINANACNGTRPASCATLTAPEIHTGADPQTVVLDPETQTLYIANEVDDDVSVIDASRCNAETTRGCRHLPPQAPVPAPFSPVADPAVHTVYVPSGADSVAMVDTRQCNAFTPAGCSAELPTVTVGALPFAATVDATTHTVYVADIGSGTTGSVSVIDDRACNATVQTGCGAVAALKVPGNPNAVVINPRTDTLYVTTNGPGGLPQHMYVFNGATCDAADTIGCTQTPATVDVGLLLPGGMDVDEATNTVYVSTEASFDTTTDGLVEVVNGSTCDAANTAGCGQAPASVTVGLSPQQVGVDQATDTVYTANQGDASFAGTVSIINGATCNATTTSGCGQVPATAPSGFGPINLAIDQANGDVYVDNWQDTSVTVIRGPSCDAADTSGCGSAHPRVSVSDYPNSVAIDRQVDTAYVGSAIGAVSVIPLLR